MESSSSHHKGGATGRIGLLTATTAFAKANPKADIWIPKDTGVSIGRNTANKAGTVPNTWAQVSGVHCHIRGTEATGFTVTDSSTNGTFIISGDGTVVRIPKKQSRPLLPGQHLRLSALADGGNREDLPEYRLDICEPPDNVILERSSKKRQRHSSGGDAVSIQHEIAGLRAENQATNEQLRREQQLVTELKRSHKGEVQAALKEKQAALQQLADEQKAHSEELAKLNTNFDTNRESLVKQSLQHAAVLAEHSKALDKAAQEQQKLQAELNAAQVEVRSAQTCAQGNSARFEELLKAVEDRDGALQAAQSRLDAEVTQSSQLRIQCNSSQEMLAQKEQELEMAISGLEDARIQAQKRETDLKFANANYKNLQRVARPLAAMARDTQSAEQSLVAALTKAAKECFARQSGAAVAAQELQEMLLGLEGDEPSQTLTCHVTAGDVGSPDGDATQGMEFNHVTPQSPSMAAPTTKAHSTPTQPGSDHQPDSPVLISLADGLTSHATTANSERTQRQLAEGHQIAALNTGSAPSVSQSTEITAKVPNDNERHLSAFQPHSHSSGSVREPDTQQISAESSAQTDKDSPVTEDEEMSNANANEEAAQGVAVAAAAVVLSDNGSSGSSSEDSDDSDEGDEGDDDEPPADMQMDIDVQGKADIENGVEEDSDSVPAPKNSNHLGPQRIEHATMF